MRLSWALAGLGAILQVGSAALLRQAPEPTKALSAGDAALAFADKASTRLRLLSGAAQQVLATPGIEEEPLFSKSLYNVSTQLQESAKILQKWGADYARNADANEMAVTLAEQGAAYEVQDLKKQLRAAIEADQQATLAQPKKLEELSKKVSSLRSKLDHLIVEEAQQKQAGQKPQKAGTALLSNVWPPPPRNATKAELGLFMHGTKITATADQQEEEDTQHLAMLESHLGSLETQLKAARTSLADSHAATMEAHRETQEVSK